VSSFLIGAVSLNRNSHMLCFTEFMRNLAAALRALGHEVDYATPEAKPGRLIIIDGGNMGEHPSNQTPRDSILFNSEQLAALKNPSHFMKSYRLYQDFSVWDYSQANIDAMQKLGMRRTVLCPLGYVADKYEHHFRPARSRIALVEDEDIDVLFYGSVAGPRREILDALDRSGLKVKRLWNVYGAERDAWIARSKVVVNLHFYPRGVFEIFRVSHLLENRRCVVTEAGGCDEGLEELASRACAYVSREQIVETCRMLVADARKRREIAERGHEEFKKIDFVENVRRALEVS